LFHVDFPRENCLAGIVHGLRELSLVQRLSAPLRYQHYVVLAVPFRVV